MYKTLRKVQILILVRKKVANNPWNNTPTFSQQSLKYYIFINSYRIIFNGGFVKIRKRLGCQIAKEE